MKTISVCHATCRPEKAISVMGQWIAAASHPARVSWMFGIDAGDSESDRALHGCPRAIASPGGVVHATNACYQALRDNGPNADLYVNCSDDMEAPAGWDDALEQVAVPANIPSVVLVSDGIRDDGLVTLQIVNRPWLDAHGWELFRPEYQEADGIYADTDLTREARENGWIIEARHIKFVHRHPLICGADVDQRITEHNDPRNYRIGRELFLRRYGDPGPSWGKLAVGVRIGHAPDPAFFCDWTDLILGGLRPGDAVLSPAVRLPHGPAANFLLEQFLSETECDSLMLLDDDMCFDADAVERLRSTPAPWHCGVMAGLCSCGRAPFLPVALMLNQETAKATAVLDYGDQDFIQVTSTGFAFTLIRRRLIAAMLKDNDWDSGIVKWEDRLGEDGNFCVRAQRLGFTVGIATRVRIGHRVTFTITPGIDGRPKHVFRTFGVGHQSGQSSRK